MKSWRSSKMSIDALSVRSIMISLFRPYCQYCQSDESLRQIRKRLWSMMPLVWQHSLICIFSSIRPKMKTAIGMERAKTLFLVIIDLIENVGFVILTCDASTHALWPGFLGRDQGCRIIYLERKNGYNKKDLKEVFDVSSSRKSGQSPSL